ncbi:hypothetical protein CGCSCA1_v006571 [Colletotrichum siamense]|nr:hypothetical protein CGCSCA1_v006571 [Colletotrichum siamense]
MDWVGVSPDSGLSKHLALHTFLIYASNSVVAIVFVAMAMAGGIAQLERARKARWDFQKRDLALQEAISRDLQHLADQLEGKPRDLRILEFLARRELSSWSTLEDPHGGFNPYGRVVCINDDRDDDDDDRDDDDDDNDNNNRDRKRNQDKKSRNHRDDRDDIIRLDKKPNIPAKFIVLIASSIVF